MKTMDISPLTAAMDILRPFCTKGMADILPALYRPKIMPMIVRLTQSAGIIPNLRERNIPPSSSKTPSMESAIT